MIKKITLFLLFITLISCSQTTKKEMELKTEQKIKVKKKTETNFIKKNEKELFNKGFTNFKIGSFDKAIENYTELIKITDSDKVKKKSFIHRGQAYERIKKSDLAIEDYTSAIKLDSSDFTSFIDRGLAKLYSGKIESGKKDFNHILSSNSKSNDKKKAYYWLAKVNFSKGEFDKAISNATKAIKIDNRVSDIYFIRASSYDWKQDYKSSIKDYTKMIELKPRDYIGYASRGIAKINQLTTNGNINPNIKEKESACSDLKKAKELGDKSVDDMIYVACGK